MEEILSTAAYWLFDTNKQSVGLISFLIAIFTMMWLSLKLMDMIENFELFHKNNTFWENSKDSKIMPPYVPPKTINNTIYHNAPLTKPKYPPKAVFFARENGETRVIEGPQEPNFLTYWQKRDWEDWIYVHPEQKDSKKAKKSAS